MTTKRIIYTGHVQGVGFRFRTRLLSQKYAIKGYVKNLVDGTVEVVVQGEAGEIDRFLGGLRKEMRGLIENESISPADAQPSFKTFDIAY